MTHRYAVALCRDSDSDHNHQHLHYCMLDLRHITADDTPEAIAAVIGDHFPDYQIDTYGGLLPLDYQIDGGAAFPWFMFRVELTRDGRRGWFLDFLHQG